MKKAQLKELLTQYGPIEYIWFDHAVGDGGLSHKETAAWCKSFQPGCFVGFNHGDQEGADIRLGEMGRPGPLDDPRGAGPYMQDEPSRSTVWPSSPIRSSRRTRAGRCGSTRCRCTTASACRRRSSTRITSGR